MMLIKKFKNIFNNSNRHIYLLLIILIIGIIFRFYNTPDRYGFDIDPTRDALIAIYGAEEFKFPLIGPASGIASFTFGPWYYYQLILFTILFPIAYAPFYLIGIYSVIFIFLMYVLGKLLIDQKFGLILAFLAAISPGQIGPSAGLSNPNLVPVNAVITIILFVYLITKKRSWYWFLVWGIVIGTGINHHYQMAMLLLLPLILFIYKFKLYFINSFFFLAGIFLSFIPLLIFNLQNNWHTVRGVFKYLSEGSGIYVPNSWTIYLKNFWPEFWSYLLGVPIWLGLIFLICIVFIHFYLFFKRKLNIQYLLLIFVFMIVVILLRYYSGQREYYYVLFLQPFIFLLVGRSLYFIHKLKYGVYLLLTLILIIFSYSLPLNIQRLSDREDHIIFKKEVNLLISNNNSKNFRVFTCNNKYTNRILGITYLLKISNRLSDKGGKIGITTNNEKVCNYPEQTTKLLDGIYLLNANDELLNALGWSEVTPKSVYIRTLEWK